MQPPSQSLSHSIHGYIRYSQGSWLNWCRISRISTTKIWELQGIEIIYKGILGQFETVTDPSFSDSLGDGERLFAGVDCMMSAINEMTKWCEQVKFHEIRCIRCIRMCFRDSEAMPSGQKWRTSGVLLWQLAC